MQESIFDYPKAYIPTDKREAKEDYFMQLFAWLLQNVDHLAHKYCKKLLLRLEQTNNHIIQQNDFINVETQVTVTSGRIDLVIKINDTIGFICEHKVNSLLK
ncbi:hypothetical protein [Acetobacterium tundrae]|uniref:PD-(D/E)XK nuclease family transposase n=1 Tax=Acetobacterium tundrae TaxID=132932 RepID=A0ABR6WNM3_9FIRM|nr:hypothetical protein [Acetobacterium tundrae]MBC3798098.1 hypothetical protein [Acetobacterium tundrae]